MPDHFILQGMKILLAERWVEETAVVVSGKTIKAIIPETEIKHYLPAHCYSFSRAHFLIPGLIDLHIHGANGCDVMDGEVAALQTISVALAREGVTGFLATTLTASDEEINSVLKAVNEALSDESGAAILGVHLEGPFIAADKMGAQGKCYQLPNIERFNQWQQQANHAIKVVTLAPELQGALPFIKALTQQGVVASIGHTNATYEQTCAAIYAGAQSATHLFNAMRGLHQREPGAVGALLYHDSVWAELIVDGIHVHPTIVNFAYKLKKAERLILVTDAMRAKCLKEGRYQLGKQWVYVDDHTAKLEDGTLAGSTLRMPQAIQNIMSYCQCTLIDAIKMASENPAKVLKRFDRKGSIAVGKEADLVVLNANLQVELTLREGREVFKSYTI